MLIYYIGYSLLIFYLSDPWCTKTNSSLLKALCLLQNYYVPIIFYITSPFRTPASANMLKKLSNTVSVINAIETINTSLPSVSITWFFFYSPSTMMKPINYWFRIPICVLMQSYRCKSVHWLGQGGFHVNHMPDLCQSNFLLCQV